MKKLIWIFAFAALAAFGGGKDTSGNAITENTLLGNVDGEQTKVGDINALKVETDPTVPSWAKTTEKPHYTAGEVGARPNDWMPSAVDVGAATPGGVTNIVTNVVTKAYVEGLGISVNGGALPETMPGCVVSTNINGVSFSFLCETNFVRAVMCEYNGRKDMLPIESATLDGSTGYYTGSDALPKIASDTSYVSWYYTVRGRSGGTILVGVAAKNNDTGVWIVGSSESYTYFTIYTNEPWTDVEYSVWASMVRFYYKYCADNFVPTSRKVNGQSLTSDITIEGMTDNALVLTNSSVKTKSGTAITASNVGAATTAELEATKAIVYTWEQFLDGSNVVFSITNYISGVYNLGVAKFRILEMTNGVYREVYNSREEIVMHIDNFKTNDFRIATNQVITAVDAKIASKAEKAWGQYTSAGGEAPSNTVYMTAPNTVFACGMEYERVAVGEGAVCVLTTKGAPVWTQGDEGTFKFQDDGGTNYFGFAKSDSYVIGCDTDGITVSSGIVTLTYNVMMSGVPCIWYKEDISSSAAWEQLNLPDGTAIAGASHVVSWESTPADGTEVCYINCTEAKGFFKATIEVAGSAKFMTNMPCDFSSGIFCTDGVHKVSIDWNNGSPRLIGVE